MKHLKDTIIFIATIFIFIFGCYESTKYGLKRCMKHGGTIESCIGIGLEAKNDR